MDFTTFHNYNKLVRRGQAPALTCSMCDNIVTLVSYKEEPALQCYFCGARTIPGQDTYDTISKEIDDRHNRTD